MQPNDASSREEHACRWSALLGRTDDDPRPWGNGDQMTRGERALQQVSQTAGVHSLSPFESVVLRIHRPDCHSHLHSNGSLSWACWAVHRSKNRHWNRKPQRHCRRRRQSRSVQDVVRFGGEQLKLEWSCLPSTWRTHRRVSARRDTVVEMRRIAHFR